jgi:hypothetical protein
MSTTAAIASASAATTSVAETGQAPSVREVHFQDAWVSTTRPSWKREVRYIEAPDGIAAGQPLNVEVYARDLRGRPICNALVEVTLTLPDGQRTVSGRTSPLGHMSTRQLVPSGCKGKRCVVAVRVSRDDLEGLAYSTFVTQ